MTEFPYELFIMVLTQERNVIFDPSTGSANYKGGSCPQQHACKLLLGLFLAI